MIDGAAAILIAFWKYEKKKKKERNRKILLEHKTSDSKIQNEINV